MAFLRSLAAGAVSVTLLAGCASVPDETPPEARPHARAAPAVTEGIPPAPPAPAPEPLSVIDPAEPMPPAESRFVWPSSGGVAERGGASGIAIRASGDVRAVKSGVVTRTLSSWAGLRNLVIVRHADGFYSVYGGADEVTVPVGKAVRQGEAVARFRSSGGLLRFRLYRGSTAVDPAAHLR
jgi:lipoprotein NlpD